MRGTDLKKRGQMTRSRTLLVTGILLSLLTVSALGIAAIPNESGVISACYNTSRGILRIVDEPSDCTSSETPLSWNQQGPPGEPGEEGPAGEPGVAGFTEVVETFNIDLRREGGGFSGLALAVCPSGKVATGGGYVVNTPPNLFPTLSVDANVPFTGPAGAGWLVDIIASHQLTAEVHVLCVDD